MLSFRYRIFSNITLAYISDCCLSLNVYSTASPITKTTPFSSVYSAKHSHTHRKTIEVIRRAESSLFALNEDEWIRLHYAQYVSVFATRRVKGIGAYLRVCARVCATLSQCAHAHSHTYTHIRKNMYWLGIVLQKFNLKLELSCGSWCVRPCRKSQFSHVACVCTIFCIKQGTIHKGQNDTANAPFPSNKWNDECITHMSNVK